MAGRGGAMMRTVLRVTLAFVAALATTTLLGAVIQTQFNLAALQELGVPVPPTVRLRATAHDLVGFTPTYGAVMAAGLLIAFIVSGLLARALPGIRTALHVLAGATAVVTAIETMVFVFEITPIAAARGLVGLGALAVGGALGGWVFARLAPAPANG